MRELVGAWMLVSSVTTEEGGAQLEPYGPNPKGIMTVQANGRYSIVTTRGDLPLFASNNRVTGTAEENSAVVTGSIAHFGTISVDSGGGSLILKIETSTFPNWDGKEYRWPYTITDDLLQWTVPAASGGGTATTVWRRDRLE